MQHACLVSASQVISAQQAHIGNPNRGGASKQADPGLTFTMLFAYGLQCYTTTGVKVDTAVNSGGFTVALPAGSLTDNPTGDSRTFQVNIPSDGAQ